MRLSETFKDIYELAKKAGTIDLQQRVIELREQTFELREENLSLKEKVREVESKIELEKEVQFSDGVYWQLKSDGSKDGPFCQRCFDEGRKLIRVHPCYYNNTPIWHCYACKSEYPRKE